MNWVSETRKALSTALSRVILPEILLPSLIVGGGSSILPTLLVLGRLPAALRSPAEARDYASMGIFLLLFLILAMPAISSGLYSVSRAVIMYGRGGWKDFWSGLGTFWGRLVGLACLGILALIIVAVVLGSGLSSIDFYEIPTPETFFAMTAGSLVLLLVYLAVRYFVTPVLPAMVMEQMPALKSIELGFKFAWQNPSIVVPAVAVDIVVTWLVQRITTATSETAIYEFGLTFGAVFPYVAAALVSVLVQAYFRLLHLGIYYDRIPLPVTIVGPSGDTQPEPTGDVPPGDSTPAEPVGVSTEVTEEAPPVAPEAGTPPEADIPPEPESPPEPVSPSEPTRPPEPPTPQQG